MAKFLVVIKSEDSLNVGTGLNVSQALKNLGAEDVKIVFLGPGIRVLTKNNQLSNLILNAKDNLNKLGVKVFACETAMKNYNISKEDLVYVDEISKGAEIILEHADRGYTILTF
ncbi:hypothetical protein YN1_8120 [Nanoarchaeota archaeon]